jgi:ribosome-associated translation inhibitor RaiA
MITQRTGHHIKLTESMIDGIISLETSISKYNLDIETIETTITDDAHNKHGLNIHFKIITGHGKQYDFNSSDTDFFVALSDIEEKSTKKIRREHDKIISEKRKKQKHQ